MLQFKVDKTTVRDAPWRTLASLPEIFALEEAEADLFRPSTDIYSSAGCWGRLFAHLTSSTHLSGRGESCGVRWERGSKSVSILNDKKYSARFARWMEVRLANQILIAAFVPHVYNDALGSYLDHRFVVGCSDPSIVPLVLLFTDLITGQAEGDNSWETASPSSTNLA